jgi:hypothetical protein
VGLLRQADEPDAPPAPGPGLGRLAELTDAFGSAGPAVHVGTESEEIAGKLFVSPPAVRNRVHRALTELGARDRAQLVVMAYQSGLVRALPPATDRCAVGDGRSGETRPEGAWRWTGRSTTDP